MFFSSKIKTQNNKQWQSNKQDESARVKKGTSRWNNTIRQQDTTTK
jgi:hypothetical protein